LIIDLRNGYGFLDLQHLDKIFPSRDSYFDITGLTGALSNLANPSSAVSTKQYRKPIAVLINSETRGGLELFAYQLGKLGRSIILGDRSPGKLGTFLESTRDGTEILIYQPAKSLLIDNNSIEGTGIEADRIVEYPFEQTSRGDPQYNAAMNALMGII
jgi:C-terminal processing protease CtpA/Prc